MGRLFSYRSFWVLWLGVFVVLLLGFGERAAAYSLPGDPSNTLPNNGAPATPWATVTRPGGNGMDAPNSQVFLHVKKSYTDSHANQFSFTVRDACDNTANDNNPANNETYFWISPTYISGIGTYSSGTVAGAAWGLYYFRCDSGGDSIITATVNTSVPVEVINGIEYRTIIIDVKSHTANATHPWYDYYYVNRFRYEISSSIGLFSYPSVYSQPTTSGEYTGVAYNNGAGYSWGWTTRFNFAYRCGYSSSLTRRVYLYDTDYTAGTGTPPSPYWQNDSHPMYYSVEKYNRYTGVFAGHATESSTGLPIVNFGLRGGQNTHDLTAGFKMAPDFIYSLVIWNVSYANSIQIAIRDPARQIYAYDRCGGVEPSFSCTLDSTATIEPGQTYQPRINAVYNGGSANATVTATVTVNGVTQSAVTTMTPNTSTDINIPPPITFNTAGTFPITKSITAVVGSTTYGPINCNGSTELSVVARPYFKVFNGGATVGAGFNNGTTTCTLMGGGQVSAFASSVPNMHGASTEYDLKALGVVASTFYSSSRQPSALPNYKALTLANNSASETYGGNFGGTSCITDYYSMTKKVDISEVPGNVSNITAIDAIAGSDEQLVYTSDATITGGSLNAGDKLAIFVDGDAYISGNITLATNYSDLDDIPFFALVVKGNIKIAPSVTQLDGIFIAQPGSGGSGGTIYTCLNADNTVPNLYNSCRTKLTFNGFVVAKNLKLLRTVGTLSSGPANETASSANIAEVFNGMPELYLANPAFKVDGSATELYDSITSLPPLL